MTVGNCTVAFRSAAFVLVGMFGILATGVAPQAASSYSIQAPAAMAPEKESALAPGLAVKYVKGNYRFISEIRRLLDTANEWAFAGTPLPALAYADKGRGKAVLSSEESNFIAAKITGYLHFPEPGAYEVTVWSNDGVLVNLNGVEIYEDPDRHVCRSLDDVVLNVPQAGHYPLTVYFFQRYVSYCLEVEWTRPSGGGVAHIPAEFFMHDPAAAF